MGITDQAAYAQDGAQALRAADKVTYASVALYWLCRQRGQQLDIHIVFRNHGVQKVLFGQIIEFLFLGVASAVEPVLALHELAAKVAFAVALPDTPSKLRETYPS
jgi:hypothetical protein